jgi:uncharacterized protein YndB with AHSA1/START domain
MSSKNSIRVDVQLEINGAPDQIFSALTTGISMWWGAPYLLDESTRSIVLEPKIGGRFYERWGRAHGDSQGALLGTVVAIERPRILRLQGPFALLEGSALGLASFDISGDRDKTTLKFSFVAHGDFEAEAELKYGRGWHDLLGRLKFFIEGGDPGGLTHDPSLHADFDL